MDRHAALPADSHVPSQWSWDALETAGPPVMG